MKKSLLIVLISVLLIGCASKQPSEIIYHVQQPSVFFEPTEPVIVSTQLSLLMVGDGLLHGAVYKDALKSDGNYDFTSMLRYVKPIVQKYDLAFYNQESILGGVALGLSSYPTFNSPQSFGDQMIGLGFNLVSQANNHSLDKSSKGIESSVAYWKTKATVLTAGTYVSQEDHDEIRIMTKNNISYSLLSYTYGTNGITIPNGKTYLVNYIDKDKIKADVEKVRSKVDVLMVSLHFGTEYTHVPTDYQIEIATYLASLGVDIVIGHHPHVIQPITHIGKTLVIYSLGNFISSQVGTDRLTGMMAAVNIKKTWVNGVSSIEILNPRADFVYTSYNASIANFVLVPFDQLSTNILSTKDATYAQMSKIVTSLDKTIQIGGIR